MKFPTYLLPAALLAFLVGCGGGETGAPAPATRAPSAAPGQPANPPDAAPAPLGPDVALSSAQPAATALPPAAPGAPLPAEPLPPGPTEQYLNKCEKPSGAQRAGTLRDEQSFLRLWADETYLWNKEVPNVRMADYGTAIDYFQALKTPALTASGRAKDRYHYTYPQSQWEELQQGVSLGYGLTFMRNSGLPRTWVVGQVEAGSPAAAAGIRRGDELLAVDGIDFINAGGAADVARLNAGLFPKTAGERHLLRMGRGLVRLDAWMQSARVSANPVPKVQVIDTQAGKVGYLMFNSHNDVSEQKLIDAFTTLRDAGVKGLVLDLRYNGGGLVTVASQVGYMIAGPGRALGRTFEKMLTNNPQADRQPTLFTTMSLGQVPGQAAPRGTPLPTLDLGKVTIISGPGTCSASESIVNGLRGIDVEVELVGGATCGKPYAFIPTPNCGTYYFMIQFQGTNAKGWGDYGDGFAPTCAVKDDFQYELGDAREKLLQAALTRNTSGVCPAPQRAAARLRSGAPLPEMMPVRPEVTELKILR